MSVESLRATNDEVTEDTVAMNEMNPGESPQSSTGHSIEIIIPESVIDSSDNTVIESAEGLPAPVIEAADLTSETSVDAIEAPEVPSERPRRKRREIVAETTDAGASPEPPPIIATESPAVPQTDAPSKPEVIAKSDVIAKPDVMAEPEAVRQEATKAEAAPAPPTPSEQKTVTEPKTALPTDAQLAASSVAAIKPDLGHTTDPRQAVPTDPVVSPVAKSEKKKNADDDSAEPTFRDLNLLKEVVDVVEAGGYTHPTKIQARIIPHMLKGRDVLAQSQTGSGKTAAFALPVLSQLDPATRSPQVLVLTPTRELAIQVARAFSTYGASLPDFRVAAIYGGQDYEPQLKQIRRGVHVIVGTPGRVIDHVKRETLKLDTLKCLVLDEADEMLNMGFLEDVEFVLQQTPPERQVALFSATLPDAIRKISQRYLNDPAKITIKQKTATAESIRQRALFVAPRLKMEVLKRFLEVEETDGVIVFTKTKDATITVAEKLGQSGFSTIALNGDMPQSVRERAIQNLKSGKIDILVATDVAARGLDVQRISHVVNFDLPHDSESYVHRIGRTGRAGRKGEAILLLSNGQRGKMKMIERATNQKIEVIDPPSTETLNLHRIERFKMDIAKTVADKDLSVFEELVRDCGDDAGIPMEKIAAALAHLAQKGRPFLAKELPEAGPRDRDDRGNGQRDERGRRERFDNRDGDGGKPIKKLGPPRPGMTRYRLDVGRKDRVKVGSIVGAIANEGNIDGEFIGPLRIFDTFTIVDLPEGMPNDVYQTLSRTRVAGKPLRLQKDDGGPNRGEIAERGGRHNKPHGKFSGPRGKFSGPKGKGGKFNKGKKKG